MIVVKEEDRLLLFDQHLHALASGVIGKNWGEASLPLPQQKESVEYAVANHDRGWIPLDQHPVWNEEKGQPFSFMDYPMEEKVKRYQEGVDAVEEKDDYSALLCSMHYCSFFPNSPSDTASKTFLKNESERQARLRAKLDVGITNEAIDYHFQMLQFCDDLSLYCCMNQPGVTKDRELSWFKNGFRQAFPEAPEGLIAHYIQEEKVSISPFPLQQSVTLHIPYRLVMLSTINEIGWEEAWKGAPSHIRTVSLVPA
ncbi:DUF3891 family protein [Pontibacillus salicampi]|uniref:DUF3891 family protein n=1 Tax=Pontibacillus salicampi TaxID=1449801 RepID=A0ABV6LU46_9BACI